MKSPGEIEAQAGEAVNRFLQKAVGRGASTVSATLGAHALYVHLQDVLTIGERSLACRSSPQPGRGQSMVREARDHLVRESREELTAALAGIVGSTPSAMLHDVDPASGDELIAFLFAARVARKGRAVAGLQEDARGERAREHGIEQPAHLVAHRRERGKGAVIGQRRAPAGGSERHGGISWRE